MSKNLFDLSDKTIVVTGANGIIGSAVCKGLLEANARVALLDLNVQDPEKASARLTQDFPDRTVSIRCDVSQSHSVQAAVCEIIERWGKIDVLHNNAAWKSEDLKAFFMPFEEYSLEEWRKIMAVNVEGMVLMAQQVGKQMVQQKTGGSIIQTASIYGIVAPDQRIYEGSEYLGMPINTPAIYAASKGAVLALTQYLATYWARHQIRVNSITPGGVQSGQNETFVKKYSEKVPLGRMASPRDMIGAVIYLASDASQYVTGHNLVVDGGFTIW